ncbi:MAG: hypothetical protein BHW60_08035 [Sutterella sp. 54_7]|nr:MAG: hypothetical protein BHW60_08035 [Sutterella sp. 54_7]
MRRKVRIRRFYSLRLCNKLFEIMTLRTGLNCGHFRICSIRTMTSRALNACRCMPIGTKVLGTCSRTAEREDGE